MPKHRFYLGVSHPTAKPHGTDPVPIPRKPDFVKKAYGPAMDAKIHRHPNEHSWFIVSAAAGGVGWFFLTVFTIGIGLIVTLAVLGLLWVFGMVIRAQILGNAVLVGPKQHPQLDAIAEELCRELEIKKPDIFVMSGSGLLNAFAIRFLGKGGSYVILMAELVDLCLRRGKTEELRAIMAHELAHHALGHVDPAKQLLLLPSRFVTFLPQAYSRSCELSCDRVALALVRETKPMRQALMSLASGSLVLADQIDATEFISQSRRSHDLFNLLAIVQSSHPMLTVRVEQVNSYARELGLADAPAE
jgi:Zn-dependent protease with chaperone function